VPAGTIFPRRARRALPNPQQPIGNKDLQTVRVVGTAAPPQNEYNPPVTRRIRFKYNYTGATLSSTITPAAVITQDQGDYGTSGARFNNTVRFHRVEAWFGTSLSTSASIGPPNLQLEDNTSGQFLQDNAALGVDWAHVAMRPCLANRITAYSVASSAVLFTITVPAATGLAGSVIVDVTVSMC
jgi:hypothetical protein